MAEHGARYTTGRLELPHPVLSTDSQRLGDAIAIILQLRGEAPSPGFKFSNSFDLLAQALAIVEDLGLLAWHS